MPNAVSTFTCRVLQIYSEASCGSYASGSAVVILDMLNEVSAVQMICLRKFSSLSVQCNMKLHI